MSGALLCWAADGPRFGQQVRPLYRLRALIGSALPTKEAVMAKQVIAPTKLEKAVGYAHAIRCGKTVYISGQIAHDANGKLVGQGDARAQGEQVYQNIKGILEFGGHHAHFRWRAAGSAVEECGAGCRGD